MITPERFWKPLKINPKYEKLVPKLIPEDYSELEASIIFHKGAFDPIKINSKGEILDGHTRYNICTKNALGFTTETVDLPTELDEKIYVIETNLKRRQLNKFQGIELNLVLAPLLEEKGKQHMLAGVTLVSNDTRVDTLKTVAKKSKAGRATVAKVKKILEKAPEKTKKKVRDGKQSIESAYLQVKEVERKEKQNELLSEVSPKIPEGITLYQDDFSKVVEIPDNSIQLILTDPPYPEEFLECWTKLSEFAEKKLVPGGFLIAYCGHFHLPTVLDRLREHLNYFWVAALIQPAQHALVHSRNVFCDWKPILIFNKPPLTLPAYFGDVIKSESAEKDHHEWQQGKSPFEMFIENFCPPNGVVLDPMAGSGTTLIAAKKLGRKSIGIECNPETFVVMQNRLAKEPFK